jgi:hypothetical protein
MLCDDSEICTSIVPTVCRVQQHHALCFALHLVEVEVSVILWFQPCAGPRVDKTWQGPGCNSNADCTHVGESDAVICGCSEVRTMLWK